MVDEWKKYYEARKVSAEEAISMIKPNQSIIASPFCNEPQTLFEHLVKQKDRLKNVYLFNMIQGSPCVYSKQECLPFFNLRTFLSSPLLSGAYEAGRCEHIPINFSKIPEWIESNDIDVVFIQTTPPNNEGYCSLGISIDYTKQAIKKGNYVIAQINEEEPWTCGDTMVHVSEIDAFVSSNQSLLTIPNKEIDEVERRIGENVAKLIPDKSTLQIGIGTISESALLALSSKKDLGIHTGTFSPGIMHLVETGVVTNKFKTLNKGKIVSTSCAGSEDLYKYVANNPLFEFYPVSYTHSIRTLAQIDNFYSVNSAIEVDLSGQINAEQIESNQISGVGGQMDFIHGSQVSKGGKSIIALPSTTKNDSISRITTNLSTVTSLKTEVDFIVTEYGVASLFGKTLNERAEELISIAHPKFREGLKASIDKKHKQIY